MHCKIVHYCIKFAYKVCLTKVFPYFSFFSTILIKDIFYKQIVHDSDGVLIFLSFMHVNSHICILSKTIFFTCMSFLHIQNIDYFSYIIYIFVQFVILWVVQFWAFWVYIRYCNNYILKPQPFSIIFLFFIFLARILIISAKRIFHNFYSFLPASLMASDPLKVLLVLTEAIKGSLTTRL